MALIPALTIPSYARRSIRRARLYLACLVVFACAALIQLTVHKLAFDKLFVTQVI